MTLDRTSALDNDNRVTGDTTVSASTTTTQTYKYTGWDGATYSGPDQGVVTYVEAVQGGVTTRTNYYYTWWDEAKQSSIRVGATNPANPNSGLWAPGAPPIARRATV